jgi:hypothetical protein
MAVGVIIPDRGDRPQFLKHLFFMLDRQTVKPDFIELVNYKATSKAPDLTPRIRFGFDSLKKKGCDVVLIMENDDFYSEDYIETMLFLWELNGKPEIFGTNSTIYYHIGKREFRKLEHEGRASLMNTLISTKADIQYPNDSEVYLDMFIWKQLKGVAVDPCRVISIGIKHGFGLCGGNGHNGMQFKNKDKDLSFLSSKVDPISLEFYKSFFND